VDAQPDVREAALPLDASGDPQRVWETNFFQGRAEDEVLWADREAPSAVLVIDREAPCDSVCRLKVTPVFLPRRSHRPRKFRW